MVMRHSGTKTRARAARSGRRWHVAVLLVALLGSTSCRKEPESIVIAADRISVFNHSRQDWSSVRLTLNRYYVAEAPLLRAGGRFDAPLDRFQGGFGRYFDRKRERVRSVAVAATAADGSAVKLAWPAQPQ